MAVGLYGPEYFQYDDGGPARGEQVFVFLTGTQTKAVLYYDVEKNNTASNPAWTDDRGELVFYAEEGYYDLYFPASNTTVPIEVAASTAPGGGVGGGYEYTVVTPAMLHQINHGLGWKPQPLNLDSLGRQVEQDRVAYPAPGIIEVIFEIPFGPGKIYLS